MYDTMASSFFSFSPPPPLHFFSDRVTECSLFVLRQHLTMQPKLVWNVQRYGRWDLKVRAMVFFLFKDLVCGYVCLCLLVCLCTV